MAVEMSDKLNAFILFFQFILLLSFVSIHFVNNT